MDDIKPVASDAIDLCTISFYPAYLRQLLKASILMNRYLFGVAEQAGLDPDTLVQCLRDRFDKDKDLQHGLDGLHDVEKRCATLWSMIRRDTGFDWEEFASNYRQSREEL